jgi:hypothetical protein
MAINPLQAPINYAGMVPQINIGQQFSELGQVLAERQKRIQAEEIKKTYAIDLQGVINDPSMKNFNTFSLKYPQQREVIKDVASRFTQEQQDSEFNVGRDVAVSLENNNPEAALNILNQTIEARKKSNLPTTVYDQIQQILSNTEDPDRIKKAKAQTNFSLTLLNPEKFSKVVDSLEKQQLAPSAFKEAVAKADKALADAITAQSTADNAPARAAADAALIKAQAETARIKALFTERMEIADLKQKAAALGLTTAQTNQVLQQIRKLHVETQKAVLELEASKTPNGTIPEEKRPDAEAKFRREYSDQTKGYQDVKSAYGRILAVSKPKTPDEEAAADLALVFNFIKMQDPGSTVNSGEFANAQNAAGVPDRITNQYNKLLTGARLSPSQRNAFTGQAKNLYEAAGQQEAIVRKGIERIARGYGLNSQNIFYTPTEITPTPPAPPPGQPLPASATIEGKTYSRPATFTDLQWRNYLIVQGVIK